eukprot:scaffold44582_cov19-Prasinocladus_malaysianus.AAC.1
MSGNGAAMRKYNFNSYYMDKKMPKAVPMGALKVRPGNGVQRDSDAMNASGDMCGCSDMSMAEETIRRIELDMPLFDHIIRIEHGWLIRKH